MANTKETVQDRIARIQGQAAFGGLRAKSSNGRPAPRKPAADYVPFASQNNVSSLDELTSSLRELSIIRYGYPTLLVIVGFALINGFVSF